MAETGESFIFDDETLERCDTIAQECLGTVIRRRLYPKLKSALYENHTFSEYILVCYDGSILFSHKDIGVEALVVAFKNGLRSDQKAVQDRNRTLDS